MQDIFVQEIPNCFLFNVSPRLGLADTQALNKAVTAYQACHFIGMPECGVRTFILCLVIYFIIWPVRPRAQFPWKTIREKVPYEGRTRQIDRAGKTRTALLEMRTALLETATTKSMAKVCSLQNESRKWTFWERILLSRRIVPCRTTSSVANSLQKQRKKFNTTRKWRSSHLSQKSTSKQAVKETTFLDKLSDN